MKRIWIIPVLLAAAVATAGCSNKDLINQKNQQIEDLNQNVDQLQGRVDELQSSNEQLEKSLADLRSRNQVLVEKRDGLMHITLDGAARFETAKAELSADARQVLDRLADALSKYPDRWVLIEGHADQRPIAGSYRWKYASNWELSTARANAVLHYLIDNHNVDPEHVKSVGLGPYHPVDGSGTPEAQAKNRRVEIVVGSKMDIENRMASRSK